MFAGMQETTGEYDIDTVINKSWNLIFTDFPIWNESYRFTLCSKILKHYWMQEIGQETVALWKFYINRKLNEIMPYYNELYKTIIKDFSPKYQYEKTRTLKDVNKSNINKDGTTSFNNTSNDTRDYEDKLLHNDTPQGGVTGLDTLKYLTTYDKNSHDEKIKGTTKGSGKANDKTQMDGNRDVTEKEYGYYNVIELLNYNVKARNAVINIDMMIIDELSNLFMLIY